MQMTERDGEKTKMHTSESLWSACKTLPKVECELALTRVHATQFYAIERISYFDPDSFRYEILTSI